MDAGGYIKLRRKIEDWEWFHDNPTFCLFMHMLLLANWKDKRWKGIEIRRGQFISGRKALAEVTGLTEQQIRTAVNKLKSTREITSTTTKVGTLYTIVNYNTYQDDPTSINQQSNQACNHAATSEQPSSNHNRKNKRNNIPPIVPQGDGVKIAKSDWDAFCKHYWIEGIPFTSDLTDQVLAHLLTVLREQKQGAKIRQPLAVAKKRAEAGDAERQDQRAVQAWLHPPPSEKECHCGGELISSYATGGGYTALTCQECGRIYTRR